MADISKITLPNGSSYDFKDSVARSGLAEKAASSHTHSEYALKSKYGDTTIDVGRKDGTTVGEFSVAEGYETTASGIYSHAEGWLTTASGQGSKASGYNTDALGDYSCVGGFFSQSLGHSSFAYGNRAKTSKNNEVAFGAFNLSNDDTLFSVGDGKGDNGKHNAFEITTTGGKLHDKDIATVDDIPEISELIYTIRFSEITWGTSGYGKYYYTINIPAATQILSVILGYWEGFYPDEVVQPTLSDSTTIELMSNTAKATGLLAIRISYI